MRLLAVASVALLVAACFYPWVRIESKGLVLTGMEAMNFKSPAYFHFFFSGAYLLLLLLNRGWTHKATIVFAALNVAWAVRNFLLITACHMGDCPEKQTAIYLIIPASLLMLTASLFWKTRA